METVPKDLRGLRACMVCSLIKTFDQFEMDGCENCDEFLRLKNNKDNVFDCTSSNFDGSFHERSLRHFSLRTTPPEHNKRHEESRNSLQTKRHITEINLHTGKNVRLIIIEHYLSIFFMTLNIEYSDCGLVGVSKILCAWNRGEKLQLVIVNYHKSTSRATTHNSIKPQGFFIISNELITTGL